MSRLKRACLLLITILIVIGVCGCMNEEQDFKTPVLEYLKDKYECNFNVLSVSHLKGTDGKYVQLVCESSANPGEAFRVECYPADGEKKGDHIAVGGDECVIFEKYSDIVFAKQMEQELMQVIGGDVFVRCEILSNHSQTRYYGTTKEQFQAGMKACLEQPDVYSYVSVYVVMGADADMDQIQSAVESYALNCNAHSQYLAFAVMPELVDEVVTQHYEENKNSFVAHMGVCEWVLHLESVELNRAQGIVNRFVEKG